MDVRLLIIFLILWKFVNVFEYMILFLFLRVFLCVMFIFVFCVFLCVGEIIKIGNVN